MKMYTKGFNSRLELEAFVNAGGIQKDQIVTITEAAGGLFYLYYYSDAE